MEAILANQETWIDDFNTIYLSENGDKSILKVVHYYGKARKNSIRGSIEFDPKNTPLQNAFNKLKRRINEEKKILTPLHGCTHYIARIIN